MRTFFIVVLMLGIAAVTDAQTWEWQNPLPQGNDLKDITFVEGNNGWAVGNTGAILHTINGGSSWVIQNGGTSDNLNGVAFVNANNGWAVGGLGKIRHTTDGGSSWVAQISGTTNYLLDIFFVDANNGWAVGNGGTVLNTTNGGETWALQTSTTSNQLYNLHFVNTQNGWVVGINGTILHTTNGGSTWSMQSSGTISSLTHVAFVDVNVGWIVGWNGTVLHTTNGGGTWIAQDNGTTYNLSNVYFVNANIGWASGYDYETAVAPIFHTTNGGDTWTAQSIGCTCASLPGLSFIDENNGWAVGANGMILHTTNGGNNWTPHRSGSIGRLSNASFVDEYNGWAVGNDVAILHSTNGGGTWSTQSSGLFYGNLFDVEFVDVSNGWTVGVQGASGTILHTMNGGDTWIAQSSGTSSALYGVDFISGQIGWAVGDQGVIRHTTNGGGTWTAQSSGNTNALTDVSFVDADNGWVVGGSGTILHTTNGGSTWVVQNSGTTYRLQGVDFFDVNNGWAVGGYSNSGCIILHTSNGGDTWSTQTNGSTYALYNVFSVDTNNGYAVGYNGIMCHTTNSGTTWATQFLAQWDLSGLVFVNANVGWTVGNYGVILHSTAIPVLALTFPNGGEIWTLGELDTIKWTSENLSENVKIELNRSYPGATWETIAGSTANTGFYPWQIEGSTTSTARIRISGVTHTTAGDTSDANFTIALPNVAPDVFHDMLHDQEPEVFTVTAIVTDDAAGFITRMLYWPKSGGTSDSVLLTATGNPDEYAASVGPLAENNYCYFLRVTDVGGLTACTDTFCFEVRAEWGALQVYDDSTAEASHWSENNGYKWAVKYDVSDPYYLCGAYIGLSAEHPDLPHTPIRVQVFLNDGLDGLPGTSVWSKSAGSIGNVIGGIPADSDGWAYVVVRDSLGNPLALNTSFYVSVGNEPGGHYESFLSDTSGINYNRSFVYDPCDSVWYAESDSDSSCRSGNRMIWISGFALTSPTVVISTSGNDVHLNWDDLGAPYYRVFSSESVQLPDTTLEGVSTTNSFTDENALNEIRKFYIVISSTTP